MTNVFETRNQSGHDDHWIPLSDLMTGLMMIFLLIAITYMARVEADTRHIKESSAKIKEIATLYQQMKTDLYDDLRREFAKDLPRWDAEMLPDATIRFKAPDVLFDSGRSDLKERFKDILASFFPRYVAVLGSDKFRKSIEEIRIEGYTSSYWQSAKSEQDAYFQNMRLSQDRTRSALEYVMSLPLRATDLDWLREHVTANGLSYSKRIFNSDGTENYSRSQRVEFRVRTDAESRIAKILETVK
jgi:outer membrane protein OmpA-like peptidoglycan-associated protein